VHENFTILLMTNLITYQEQDFLRPIYFNF